MTGKIFGSAGDLKEGKYVLIDDIPCKIVGIDTSKPGKHGAAKMRITAIGIFDGQKKNLLVPSDADVEIPMVERGNAQVVSVSGKTVQLMDLTTFETYELEIPEEFMANAAPGKEAEVLGAMGRRTIVRIK
ncbi:MAG: translation initiation factor IF-5A [Candidatus Micrarchaeota archaeon]|nr:translation initiation factor IF-5A [Candidatus Micrarchaeota archaeon]